MSEFKALSDRMPATFSKCAAFVNVSFAAKGSESPNHRALAHMQQVLKRSDSFGSLEAYVGHAWRVCSPDETNVTACFYCAALAVFGTVPCE